MRFKRLKIYLISRSQIETGGLENFLKDNALSWNLDETASSAEHIVEAAGRICYMSFLPDKSKTRHPTSKYIANLIKKEHESVLEHVSWSFILDDVSRAFTHQLVRHRVGFAFSQLSQQYHVESDAAFVVPTGLPETSPSAKLWEDTVSAIQRAYKALLSDLDSKGPQKPKERKRWHRSIARSLMPNATATTIAITANARALRHFFRVRGTIEGDYEMREVCAALLEIVSQDSPALFADFAIETHIDGEKIVRLRQEPNNS